MIIDREKKELNYIFKGLWIIFLYFFISLFKYMPFYLLHINPNNINDISLNIYSTALEIMMIFIIISVFEKEIHLAIKDLKKNHKEYFSKYLKIYFIGLVFMIGSNMIINLLGGGISDNENTIRNEFSKFPIYTYISSVFLAPILEELIFRFGIRAIFKNNFVFIFISGVIFGSLHLIGTPIDMLFPLYLISYCSCGFAFAYILTKTNNVLVPASFHFMHNGIIMSLQVFLLIFT